MFNYCTFLIAFSEVLKVIFSVLMGAQRLKASIFVLLTYPRASSPGSKTNVLIQGKCVPFQDAFDDVVKYFGENPKTTPPSVFFPVFVRFVKAYKVSWRAPIVLSTFPIGTFFQKCLWPGSFAEASLALGGSSGWSLWPCWGWELLGPLSHDGSYFHEALPGPQQKRQGNWLPAWDRGDAPFIHVAQYLLLIHTDKVKSIENSNNFYMNQGMSVGHAVTKVREILCAVYRPDLSGGIS